MRKKADKKNLIISILIILLLALSIGYAAFSDILTISGTANAKGTFDLEFQNAEIVKNVGADADKTTVVISEDKNTLTVNVADLSYPGSGVEFSVDIVNVGTIPAEVQAVTPTNITGSDKIKITGLDVIKTDHPKIEAGDKCNIHFTVEWPADAGEILDNESSISFGLQVEYTQSTGEIFEGNSSHTDTDKNGNTVNGGEVEKPTYETLISQITPQDYGKSINYTATVMNNETQETQKVSNWKVLYNDKSNIYLILDDYLPTKFVSVGAIINNNYLSAPYNISSNVDKEVYDNENNWKTFANGIEGAIAIGTPTLEMIIKSYNEKYGTNLDSGIENIEDRILDTIDSLYVPHNEVVGSCARYWIITGTKNSSEEHFFYVGYNGNIENKAYAYGAIRPVVKLPVTTTGTIGETIEIDGI